MAENRPHIVNPEVIRGAMLGKGFSSVEQLAHSLGLHRNTVGNYLQGSPALPSALSRILDALELSAEQVFEGGPFRRKIPGLMIAGLVADLHALLPQAAIVLYGSRARGSAKRYSDYDLGVYRSEGIPFKEFSPLASAVEEFNGRSLRTTQLTNLCYADKKFLAAIGKDLTFLAGCMRAWLDLLKKTGTIVYE